ncbi:MAG: hypothetical protein U0L62_00465 [Paludibacteraceae bacterium]|nr:hypothetical protein [Paludibacteraceae bacterium]
MKKFASRIVAIDGQGPHIRVDFAEELDECITVAIKSTLEKIGSCINRVNMHISPEGKHYAIVSRHPCATIEETQEETNQILNEYIFKT